MSCLGEGVGYGAGVEKGSTPFIVWEWEYPMSYLGRAGVIPPILFRGGCGIPPSCFGEGGPD